MLIDLFLNVKRTCYWLNDDYNQFYESLQSTIADESSPIKGKASLKKNEFDIHKKWGLGLLFLVHFDSEEAYLKGKVFEHGDKKKVCIAARSNSFFPIIGLVLVLLGIIWLLTPEQMHNGSFRSIAFLFVGGLMYFISYGLRQDFMKKFAKEFNLVEEKKEGVNQSGY